MLKTWERRLYAAALVAVPLLDLVEDRLSSVALGAVDDDGDQAQISILTAIHAHDLLWQVDFYVALLLGFSLVAASLGLLKLTRLRAPRLTVLTAFFLVPGAIGMVNHAVFWNAIYGGMSRTSSYPAMADFVNDIQRYVPFISALVLVIVVLNAGLLLSALTLWRSRTVPWWAALLAVLSPLNDLFGWDNWVYDVTSVLWLIGWGYAAWALLQGREQPPATVTDAQSALKPVAITT
jgi:hypothetical protein